MKRGEIVLHSLADAVPVACGMIAITCAMPTAYGIIPKDAAPVLLCIFCALSALLLSFWLNVPRFGIWFGAAYLIGIAALFITQFQRIIDGGTVLLYRVLEVLPGSVSRTVDMEQLLEKTMEIADPELCITIVLMMFATVFGLLLSFTLIHSKMVILSLLAPLPPLLLSLYYKDLQPALWTFLLLSVYLGYAVLGNGLRKSDKPGKALFFVLLGPLLLGLGLLIRGAAPEKDYHPDWIDDRQGLLSDVFGTVGDKALEWFGRSNPKEIDLNAVGDRDKSSTEVFKVRINRSGAFFLRTHSYGAYDGGRWGETPEYRGAWRSMEALGKRQMIPGTQLSIMDSNSNERIIPYAFMADDMIVDESKVRASGKISYSIRFTRNYLLERDEVPPEETEYYAFAAQQYTMRDGAEKDALLKIAREAGIERTGNDLETAQRVADLVRNSAEYTLTPGMTPEGEDFVLYFLQEGRRGYCVHFASATTAILQALGIPSRYTIGYYTVIPEEYGNFEWHSVPESAEHAWTEVYLLGIGWVPVDSTPGFSQDYLPQDPVGGDPQFMPDQTPTPAPIPFDTPEPMPEPTPEPFSGGQTPLPQTTPEPSAIIGAEQRDVSAKEAEAHPERWLLLLIPLVPAAWIGVGLLIRRYRETLFRNRDVKRSIPEMAHYLNRLHKYGYPKDPDADEWALEAVFSEHPMTEEHRTLLKRVHTAQKTAFREKPLKRFLLRWILFCI